VAHFISENWFGLVMIAACIWGVSSHILYIRRRSRRQFTKTVIHPAPVHQHIVDPLPGDLIRVRMQSTGQTMFVPRRR
jgi:hypothetical protein